MKQDIVELVNSQVIASVKDPSTLEAAIQSNSNIVFLLTGNILTIKKYIDTLRLAGKHVFIHLDFIEGLANDKSAIKYVASEWKPAGIITTKSHLIKVANEEGLYTIQRIFLIDTGAVKKGIEMVTACQPDAVEILPGIMPRVINEITQLTERPLIAGGLIKEESEIMDALRAGALAASVGNPKLWNLGL